MTTHAKARLSFQAKEGLKHLATITEVYKMDTDNQQEMQAWSRVSLSGDMANNRPGESAREMARLIRSEEPVRLTLARILGAKTDERAWRMGARGEKVVAGRLLRLPSTWTTIHDLPLGQNGANLDHLAIGPGGVFALNTKNVRGKVWVAERALFLNGHKTDYLWKSKAEAERVAGILTKATGGTVAVKPVVVVMGAELNIKAQPHDVTVVTRKRIRSWLEGRPRQLTSSEISKIANAARQPETWTSGSRVTRLPSNEPPTIPAPPPTRTVRPVPEATSPVASTPTPLTETLTVVPWRRYGKDRLYVNNPKGVTLGYLDRATGETHVTSASDREKVVDALRGM